MIYCNITLTLSVLARLFEVQTQKQCPLRMISNTVASRTGGKTLSAFFIRRHLKCELYIIFTAVGAWLST